MNKNKKSKKKEEDKELQESIILLPLD